MKEIKDETVGKRLERVEEQRVRDVRANSAAHKCILKKIKSNSDQNRNILKKVNECNTLISNHLIHNKRRMNYLIGAFITMVTYWGATKVNGFLKWLASL